MGLRYRSGGGRVPKGLNEDIIRVISAKKNEPDFMLQWRLKAYRHWVTLEKSQAEPKWANSSTAQSTIRNSSTTRAQAEAEPEEPGRTGPGILRTYEKLGIPLEEQKLLAGVAVDAVFDSVSVATTFKEKLAEAGNDLLLLLRSRAEASRSGAEVSGLGGALHRQLLRGAEFGRVYRWLLCLCAQGRSLPDGAFHLFSY